MDGQRIIRLVGYVTAVVVFVAGIAILLGLILPSYIPQNFRTIFGVLFLIYGIYRSFMIWMQSRRARRIREE